jgi:CsoR family transcriptional regulator, copper-sensing transcriptional repressor
MTTTRHRLTKSTTAAAAADTTEVSRPSPAVSCGCGAHDDDPAGGRKAVAVDAAIKERNIKRLRRIEGQVRGLQKMVEEDRYCADILTQVSSVHEALRSVSRALMRNHLTHCASAAFRSSEADAESMYDELVDLIYKHSR